MRTEDLIRALANDSAAAFRARCPPLFDASQLSACSGPLCIFGLILTPRADLGAVIGTPRVAFKFIATLTLIGVGGVVAFRATRPEAKPNLRAILAPVLTLLALAIIVELIASPPRAWLPLLIGTNALACLALVPVLSLVPLGAILALCGTGPLQSPRLAGAAAGLLAGGIGATFYATHCVDDSPLFVAAWYGLSITGVAVLGAVLGARITPVVSNQIAGGLSGFEAAHSSSSLVEDLIASTCNELHSPANNRSQVILRA